MDYRHKLKQHLFKKNDIHIPQLVYKYNLTGTRNVGLSNKDGQTNTREDGKSLNGLYYVTHD